jgi:hypothetical protein
MVGNGNIIVKVLSPDRATWDALVTTVTTFKAAHPEIVSVTFQYSELTVT